MPRTPVADTRFPRIDIDHRPFDLDILTTVIDRTGWPLSDDAEARLGIFVDRLNAEALWREHQLQKDLLPTDRNVHYALAAVATSARKLGGMISVRRETEPGVPGKGVSGAPAASDRHCGRAHPGAFGIAALKGASCRTPA